MAVTEYASVLGGTGNVSKSAFINMMEQRGIYVIENGENPQDLTPGFATHLAYQGLVFWYDSADALTAHDGVTCLVTADGKRFKSDGFEGAQSRFFKIEDKDLTAPPGSPTLGDSYIVATGGSGDWATHDGHVASYTARGWLFTVANAYDLAAVVDESTVYHRSVGGSWVSGFPFFTIGADTVLPSALKYGRFGLTVVNQTTDAPPGSPSDGDAYVIGPTPSGAWTGHTRKITIYQSSAWVFYTPYEGATVYDADTQVQIKYDGTQWVPQSSGYANVESVFTAASVTTASLASSSYSHTTAPTTASSNDDDPVALNYTARKAGAVLDVEYECVITSAGTPVSVTVGLQVDSDVAMTDWTAQKITTPAPNGPELIRASLQVITADALAHDYTIRLFNITGSTAAWTFGRRRLTIRERS